MQNRQEKKPWFPLKKYGYGWGMPYNVPGCLVFVFFLILCVTGLPILILLKKSIVWHFIYYITLTSVFVLILVIKGEKPGKKDQ